MSRKHHLPCTFGLWLSTKQSQCECILRRLELYDVEPVEHVVMMNIKVYVYDVLTKAG
jgi:hypothetical protein